jgi:hypothetical protein
MAKYKLGKSNNKFPQYKDELTLAELIQNAAARGLKSTKLTLYRDANGRALKSQHGEGYIASSGGGMLENPPEGTTCGCALGAMALTPKLTHPLTVRAMDGNDTVDRDYLPDDDNGLAFTYADERSMQIGLAYEQALRPEEV